MTSYPFFPPSTCIVSRLLPTDTSNEAYNEQLSRVIFDDDTVKYMHEISGWYERGENLFTIYTNNVQAHYGAIKMLNP